jgi:hypothetical protein
MGSKSQEKQILWKIKEVFVEELAKILKGKWNLGMWQKYRVSI